MKAVRIHDFGNSEVPKDLAGIAHLIDTGTVKPVIERVLPLTHA